LLPLYAECTDNVFDISDRHAFYKELSFFGWSASFTFLYSFKYNEVTLLNGDGLVIEPIIELLLMVAKILFVPYILPAPSIQLLFYKLLATTGFYSSLGSLFALFYAGGLTFD
jgi:hypothetical protein